MSVGGFNLNKTYDPITKNVGFGQKTRLEFLKWIFVIRYSVTLKRGLLNSAFNDFQSHKLKLT